MIMQTFQYDEVKFTYEPTENVDYKVTMTADMKLMFWSTDLLTNVNQTRTLLMLQESWHTEYEVVLWRTLSTSIMDS